VSSEERKQAMLSALNVLAAIESLALGNFDEQLQRDAFTKAKAEAEAAVRAWLASP
jgi:hypothetical protein